MRPLQEMRKQVNTSPQQQYYKFMGREQLFSALSKRKVEVDNE